MVTLSRYAAQPDFMSAGREAEFKRLLSGNKVHFASRDFACLT
jgi:hypothetical protein